MSTTTVNITEAAVRQAAENKISETCAKHSVSRDQLKPEVIEDAYRYAREKLTEEASLAANPYHQMYLEEKRKRESSEALVTSLQTTRFNTQTHPTVPVTSARARALAGSAWYTFTRAQKIQSLGVDPSTVNDSELKRYFGRGASTETSVDHARSNPQRHAQLREIARALDLDGR